MTGNSAATPKPDNIALAISAVLMTTFALSLGDAIIKLFSADLPMWQIFVLRSVLALPVLLVIFAASKNRRSVIPIARGWTLVRSLLLTTMWVSYYACLPHVELSVAAAAFYTLPLFTTLFSAWLAREPVGFVGWCAVVLGFAGVLLILKPTSDGFNLFALLPLISAICFALAMILTRTRCRDEHPVVLGIALNVVFVVIGLIASALVAVLPEVDESANSFAFMFRDWSAMAPRDWTTMAVLAIAIIIGSVGASIAYQNGPPALVATFDFGYVPFAVVWVSRFFLNFLMRLPSRVSFLSSSLA